MQNIFSYDLHGFYNEFIYFYELIIDSELKRCMLKNRLAPPLVNNKWRFAPHSAQW